MSIDYNYINKFKRSHLINELITIIEKTNTFYLEKKEFSLCGRIFRRRDMGKACFLEIKDISGKIQLYISYSNTKNYNDLITNIKLGDIIGVVGTLFKTKSNELSIKGKTIHILAKNLHTFSDKKYGLLDKESCYRKRYLDLLNNENTKKTFFFRSDLILHIRLFFINKKFIEVETPMMQNIAGGADAEPFKTHHNYLNQHLYLRISPELYLKKIIIGGFEKIFEIGKSFRNEGLSTRHHPEFTMLEFYEAYSNYHDMMNLTEELFTSIVNKFFNTKQILYNNNIIDFSTPFKKINFLDAIIQHCDEISISDLTNKKFLLDLLLKYNIEISANSTLDDLHCKIFDVFIEKKLINPTFILHHPLSISPLSRTTEFNSNIVERFELYIAGKEIANGFSELNNPIEQKIRFINQLKAKEDPELKIDYDYITALEYGLPPTGGEGIGLDRIIMLFTNSTSIKDVILFPLMKNK